MPFNLFVHGIWLFLCDVCVIVRVHPPNAALGPYFDGHIWWFWLYFVPKNWRKTTYLDHRYENIHQKQTNAPCLFKLCSGSHLVSMGLLWNSLYPGNLGIALLVDLHVEELSHHLTYWLIRSIYRSNYGAHNWDCSLLHQMGLRDVMDHYHDGPNITPTAHPRVITSLRSE